MEYYLIVDGKYFVGETMEEIGGYSKAVSGFFQMGNGGQLTKYEFSVEISGNLCYHYTDTVWWEVFYRMNQIRRYNDELKTQMDLYAADTGNAVLYVQCSQRYRSHPGLSGYCPYRRCG